MSLNSNFVRNTHFVAGFNFQGKRQTNVGEDLLTASGIDAETMDGTPVVFDGDIETVAVAGAGVIPDAFLYSRISEELTDAEWMLTDIVRDEVKPGDPFTIVLNKKGGIIETNLADATSLTAGDDVEIGDIGSGANEFIVNDTGEVIGTVIETDGTDFVKILLK